MAVEKSDNWQSVTEVVVGEGGDGQRLDNFLMKHLKGVPKSHIYRIVRKGEVRVNKGRCQNKRKLMCGDTVRIPPIRLEQQESLTPSASLLQLLRRSVLFEDDRFLFLDKPAGVAVHGGSGVSHGVIEGLRQLRPDAPYLELAHRLDRDTSGCLVIAKRRSALRAFHGLTQSGGIDKRYRALVMGVWQGGERSVNAPLLKRNTLSGERIVTVSPSGKMARTLFRPLTQYRQGSLLEVKLVTGRTHQIRVHAKHIGHPLAADPKYGDAQYNQQMTDLGLKRVFLHAHSIRFTLPEIFTYDLVAPLPEGLQQLLQRLEPIT
ncbi:MAG: RluA family pseudouridine synthase [Gammaproteobacteria bacterium]|nr:RluA family pseudouridine synthase [Gammaproteobacteria bacterium]